MQKLEERNTYTPADIPHVRSNCDLSLNSSEGRNSVLGKMPDLKTSSNNLTKEYDPLIVKSGFLPNRIKLRGI